MTRRASEQFALEPLLYFFFPFVWNPDLAMSVPPHTTTAALTTPVDQPPLERTVNAVEAPPTSSVSADVAALQVEVAAVMDSLKQLHTSRGCHHSQSFRGSRSRSRGRSTSPSRQRGELCFYHEKFGANARKCRPPCTFQPPTHAT